MTNLIVIDNEVTEVTAVNDYGYGLDIECDNGCEYKLFDSRESAGEATKEYWKDMAENDKEEFKCMVGSDTLISWCLGEWAGPGNEKTKSLEDWFDLTAEYPEEQWASYDGNEVEDIRFNNNLANEIDIEDRSQVVIYRTN